MKVLNIAYFLSVKSDYLGGADHTLFKQALLMSLYHNVTVVLPCGTGGEANTRFQKKCEEAGLPYEVFFYEASTMIRSINLIEYKKDISRIEQFVLKKRIDLLHSVQINPSVEYVARKYHIPHVMNIYSLDEREWEIPRLNIFPRYVSCDSLFFLEKWKDYLKCRGGCVRVYDDAGVQKNAENDSAVTVIGAAGTICAYKNQLEIIKAVELEIKRGRKIKLVLAGDSSSAYAEKCKDYINQHQLQEYICLPGFVDNMKAFFEKIDVFICGSKRESFPASIVEAVSCNIPVISTPVAGVPEILTDRKNAYLTQGYASEELAEAVENYYTDLKNGTLKSMLANEAETYKEHFSAEAVKGQLEELYIDMLSRCTENDGMSEWNLMEMKLHEILEHKPIDILEAEDRTRAYSRMLYLYQIRQWVAARKCYIWGAGKWGKITKILIQSLMEDIQIQAFVDGCKEGSLDGIDIIKKSEMDLQQDTAVLIAFVDGQEEAVDYLEKRNLKILRDIFIVA